MLAGFDMEFDPSLYAATLFAKSSTKASLVVPKAGSSAWMGSVCSRIV
jgi:hypothetical protein